MAEDIGVVVGMVQSYKRSTVGTLNSARRIGQVPKEDSQDLRCLQLHKFVLGIKGSVRN